MVFLKTYFVGLLLLTVALSVDRNNFKTCDTSSFCKRQHEFTSDSRSYSIRDPCITTESSGVLCRIAANPGNQTLVLTINYLAFSTFRIVIDVYGAPGKSRFRIPVGDVLIEEPKTLSMRRIETNDSLILFGSKNEKIILTFQPFSLDIFMNEVLVTSMNKRSLFNFEDSEMPRNFPPNPPVEKKLDSTDGAEGDLPPLDGELENDPSDSMSENTDKSIKEDNVDDTSVSEESEDRSDEAELNQESTDSTSDSSDSDAGAMLTSNQWTEYFKEHKDTRPNGPQSISLDIDYPGFSHAYGIPEHADSLVLKDTGQKDPYRLYNLDVFEYELNERMALYGSVPYMWVANVNATVGVFWHNPSETWVDVNYGKSQNEGFLSRIPKLFSKSVPEPFVKTRWVSESGIIDVFVMLGHTPSDVAKSYANIVGTTPLPPLFSLGYHQCRWNYNDERDVLNLDQQFDYHLIPVDNIWLDIEHTDGKRYFTWDKTKFPDPGQMVDKLLSKGRKLITVVDPHIKNDHSWGIYSDAERNEYFVKTRDRSNFDGWCWPGSSSWPDFIRPDVRKWWSNLFISYDPVRTDTMFSWNDMGEPSVFSGPEITLHKDAIHGGDWEHRDVHNLFGMYVHQATWDGQLSRSAGKERPFVLTRAFFAGSQRTSAVWTGDNTANWDHLEASIPMVLSLSIAGITFSGADVGGFFGNPAPDLLTRWYQASAYQPFFRSHAHMDTKRREPWLMPETNLKLIRAAIEDRYRLLPYWYTMFARSEADGQPVMAPIWYHFHQNSKTYDLDKQYMIGEAILVAPVTKAGASYVELYLPPGRWYQMPSTKAFEGDQTIYYPVDMSTIPVFYRGGWIVPRRERIRRSSWFMRNDPYTLFVCIDPALTEAHGYLYEDDTHSVSRDSALFFSIQFQFNVDVGGTKTGGGWLSLKRLSIPGAGDNATRTGESAVSENRIERIVFVGLPKVFQRATVLYKTGDPRRRLELIHSNSKHADSGYFGDRHSNVVVVAHASLPLKPTWRLHLTTDDSELLDEL